MASKCCITDGGMTEANLAYANGESVQFSRFVVGDGVSRVTGVGAVGAGSATFSFVLPQTPVAEGSLILTAQSGSAILRVTDDESGNLVGDIGSGVNTVDYATGAVEVTFSAAPDGGADVEYSYLLSPSAATIALVNELWSGAITSARFITDDTLEAVAMIPEGAPASGSWSLTEFGLYSIRGSSEILFAYGVRDALVKEWKHEHLCRFTLTLSAAPEPTPVFESGYPGAWALNFGNANILCNERFDHWPYGTDFTGSSAADKGVQVAWDWEVWTPGASASVEVSRQAGDVTDYAMRVKDSRVGGQVGYIIQDVPVPKAYQGRRLTLRISVKGESLGSVVDWGVMALVYDRDGTSETVDAASFVVPTAGFEVRSLTTTVPAAVDSLAVAVSSPDGFYIDVDWVALSLEDDASFYSPNKREYPERYVVQAAEPAWPTAGQLWLDTTASLLKLRNAANSAWLTLGSWAAYLGTHGTRHADGGADELDVADLADAGGLLRMHVSAHGGALVWDTASRVLVKVPFNFCSDDYAEVISKSSGDLALDITVVGANGRDGGSEEADTWYFVWVIKNPSSGDVKGLFSASLTAPTLPDGYTKKRMIGAVYNDTGSDIRQFVCWGTGNLRCYRWREMNTDDGGLGSGYVASGSFTAVDASAYVPCVAGGGLQTLPRAYVNIRAYDTGSGYNGFAWLKTHPDDGTGYMIQSARRNASVECLVPVMDDVDGTSVFVKSQGGAQHVYVRFVGFEIDI